MTTDRDALLKIALTPAADLEVPADLGDWISREIVATPQRRPNPVLLRLNRVPAPLLVTIGLLVLLGLALLVAGLVRQTPTILAMYHGGPDRTGVMPGPAPQGNPVRLWDVRRPGALPFSTMPIPFEDKVIVADRSGSIAALDIASGDVRWERDVGAAITGAPALVRPSGSTTELALVGIEDGSVVAVRVADGSEAWRSLLQGSVTASLLVADGVAYAGLDTGDVVAIDPGDGRVLWSVNVGGAISRGGAIKDGALYVGGASGEIAPFGRFSAIDLASHAVRWTIPLGDGAVGTPTVGRGLVYVGQGIQGVGTHDLVAVDIRDGTIAWRFASPTGKQVHMGGLADGQVYAVSEDDSIYALDAASGAERWTATTAARLTTPATIVGSVVFVSSEDDHLRALDARTGVELWQLPTAGHPTMAAVVDGRAYVGTDLGQVLAIGGSGAAAQ